VRKRSPPPTARAAYQFRRDNLFASRLTFVIATNRFSQDKPYHRKAATVGLPCPKNDAIALTKAALRALEPLYREGYRYQKAEFGVH